MHLFEASTCFVMTKEGRYLERHIEDFITVAREIPVSKTAGNAVYSAR